VHRNSTWIKIQQMQQYADICSLQNCKSSFAVNKYLHTVASVGFLFTSILILSSHIFVDPTCSSFTDFPTRTQYVFLSHALHVPCPSYPPLLHTFNGKTRGLYIIKFLVMQFSSATCYSIFDPTVSASWSWPTSGHVLPSVWTTKCQTHTNELKGAQSFLKTSWFLG